jgi:hypothetical protein
MKALILGLALAAVGCAVQPVTTTSYSLQAIPDAAAIVDKLPARLSPADAQRLLVQIDPTAVRGGFGLLAAKDGTVRIGGYYPYGNYYFPYANYGGYYAPYAVNCTLPYMYRFQAYFNPYSIYYGNGAGGPCTTNLTPGGGL